MIHESASIHPQASLAKNVVVGAGSIIGADVVIDEGTWIGPHVVIKGPSTIGKNNKIFQFASVGDEPQDITYSGENTRLEIGDNNIIREYCMISRGTAKGGGVTKIGNNNFFMAFSHVGHDCIVGNHIIMVNYSALSGHVIVDDYTNIGAYAAVYQYCQVGSYAFIARATYITKDVLPYIIVAGHDTSACGINTVGLKRGGFSSNDIDTLRRAYKIIFRKGLTVKQAIEELIPMQESSSKVASFINGLESASRGIVR